MSVGFCFVLLKCFPPLLFLLKTEIKFKIKFCNVSMKYVDFKHALFPYLEKKLAVHDPARNACVKN